MCGNTPSDKFETYERIGNSLYSACNAATNLYAVNALNQYTEVTGAGATQSLTYDADGHQKSAKPKAVPPGDRDFIAVPKGRSEERYPATQRQLYVTAYVSENGDTVATYEYDAFGATISQSGMMADTFRHRFSTKPWIAALGVHDYGERMYSPELRRWLSRDPIGEEGGVNLYAMCGNNPVDAYDELGLWTATAESAGESRRVYKSKNGDTMNSLAKIVGLAPKEYRKWARIEYSARAENGSPGKITSSASPGCFVSVPNVWISADLLRGGNWYYDSFVNFGGTIGRLVGTDVFTSSDHKVVKANDITQLSDAFRSSKGDIWGIVVFGHGDKNGVLSMRRYSDVYERDWTLQSELIVGIREGGYKIARAYMMQCYSAYKGVDDFRENVDYGAEWRKAAVRFYGYKGANAFLIDLGSRGKKTRRRRFRNGRGP